MTVDVLGQKMSIIYSYHSEQRADERFEPGDITYLVYNLSKLCENEIIADYLMNEVRIGEDAVIIDGDNHIVYCLIITENEIFIKTVYDCSLGKFKLGVDEKAVIYNQIFGLREINKTRRNATYA